MWLPLLTSTAYLNVTPYLQPEKYDSYGAGPILSWLSSGELLDHGRLPVLTILFVLGIVAVDPDAQSSDAGRPDDLRRLARSPTSAVRPSAS